MRDHAWGLHTGVSVRCGGCECVGAGGVAAPLVERRGPLGARDVGHGVERRLVRLGTAALSAQLHPVFITSK